MSEGSPPCQSSRSSGPSPRKAEVPPPPALCLPWFPACYPFALLPGLLCMKQVPRAPAPHRTLSVRTAVNVLPRNGASSPAPRCAAHASRGFCNGPRSSGGCVNIVPPWANAGGAATETTELECSPPLLFLSGSVCRSPPWGLLPRAQAGVGVNGQKGALSLLPADGRQPLSGRPAGWVDA